jgi:hypothetical protein
MSEKELDLAVDLHLWRAERPDEWTMDRFIRMAAQQAEEIAELKQQVEKLEQQLQSEQWVSVEDALPDDASIVLFRVPNKTYKGIYLAGCNTFEVEHLCEYFKPDEVNHWKLITPPLNNIKQ